ncbi:MAG: hypoxanthine phosphoribosyltransferase [bacterium]|jgi:hypoxanthine phosphoribosyltransferase
MSKKTDPLIQKLYSKEEINLQIQVLAKQINQDYKEKQLLIVSVLKGSLLFTADLIRELDLDVTIDFIQAKSYVGTESSGDVTIIHQLQEKIADCHVLLVEDIVDTGITLHRIYDELQQHQPKSLEICTLLDKPSRRKKPIYAKYIGFEIPDLFVVGYGLDYNQKFRNLPYVGVLQLEN